MSDGLEDCPIPDCDYQGSFESIKGHWGGSQDEDHSGNFHEAYEAYNDARGGTTGDTTEASTEGSSVDAQARAGDSDGFPEAQDSGSSGSTQDSSGGVEWRCPACNETESGVDAQAVQQAGGWECPACGEVERV